MSLPSVSAWLRVAWEQHTKSGSIGSVRSGSFGGDASSPQRPSEVARLRAADESAIAALLVPDAAPAVRATVEQTREVKMTREVTNGTDDVSFYTHEIYTPFDNAPWLETVNDSDSFQPTRAANGVGDESWGLALTDTALTDTALTDTALTDTALTDTALTDTALTDTATAHTNTALDGGLR